MMDRVSSLVTEDDSNLLEALDKFCASRNSNIVRYHEFLSECSANGISITEDAWYELIDESKVYTFAEDCDEDGIFWTVGHVVL